jgi:O-antigen/teichoic acid export membrane protein
MGKDAFPASSKMTPSREVGLPSRTVSLIDRIKTGVRLLIGSSFVRISSVYFFGSVANAILPLALLPVLTQYLSPRDYGLVATSTVLVQILVVFQGVNAYGLIARTHFDEDRNALTKLVSVAIGLASAVSLLLLCLLPFGGKYLESITKFPTIWLPLVVFIGMATAIQNNYLALCQARQEPYRFLLNQTISSFVGLGLSLVLVVGLGMDWRGRMWGNAAGLAVAALISLYGFIFRLRVLRLVFARSALRELMAFGGPLIPHVIGGWVMTMAARLYLNNMATVADTGLYSVAFNLTSPLAMLVGAANNAYVPILFQKLSSKAEYNKVRLCQVLLVAVFTLPIIALLGALVVRLILPLIVAERFYGASGYVAWMALTYAVQGVYFVFGNFVVYAKKTWLMTWRADFLGGLVLLIACPILIRWNGPIGAAEATFFAFAASTLGCITAARQAFPMPWGTALKSLVAFKNLSNRAAN